MGDHSVDAILGVFVGSSELALLHLPDNAVDEGETGAVCLFHLRLVGQINIPLLVRGLLCFARLGHRGLDDLRQSLAAGGYGINHRAAQGRGQGHGVNPGLLLCIHVGLVQRDHHGNPQLQQLRGEKQAAAQIGGIHDIDNHVGMLIPDVGAGDAFLAGEG